MALLGNILGKRKTPPKKGQSSAAAALNPRATDDSAAAARPAANSSVALGVLRMPQVTEKSAGGAGNGKYTFRVEPGVNKITIRDAVERRYGVTVTSVHIVKIHPKRRRIGRREGRRPGFTKAVVTLAHGQSIDLE